MILSAALFVSAPPFVHFVSVFSPLPCQTSLAKTLVLSTGNTHSVYITQQAYVQSYIVYTNLCLNGSFNYDNF